MSDMEKDEEFAEFDLTAEDLGRMLDEGEPVEIVTVPVWQSTLPARPAVFRALETFGVVGHSTVPKNLDVAPAARGTTALTA